MKRMTWIIALLGSIIVYPNLLAAQPNTISKGQRSSLCWKVSGNGLKKPSFIYGTIHMICPEQLQISKVVYQQLEKTTQIIFEVDIDKPETASGFATLLEQSHDTTTLESCLSAQEYEELTTFFKDSVGLPMALMKTVNPMMLSIALLPKLIGCMPASTEQRLLQHINDVVKKQRKVQIFGLETLEQQLGFLQSLSSKEQAKELYDMVKNFQSYKAKMSNLLTMYQQENLVGLKQMMDEMPGEMSSLLVTKRNTTWIPIMERFMKRSASFFAVGAGHLPGESGILMLLRSKGYTVEPIF